MTADAAPPTVLYVGGAGRSGSTLLGQVLGQVPAFVHVGELVFLWQRGVLENQLCGCSQPFLDCPFWTAVGQQAFGGWTRSEAEAAAAQQRHVERNRHIPALLAPRVSSRFRSELAGYSQRLAALYEAVVQVSDAKVIVETSKGPSHALMLHRIHDLDLSVCLLIRDSRGVAYSWTRRKRRPEVPGGDALMDNYSTSRTAVEWTSFNTAFAAAPALGIPLQRLRYEDFIAQPDHEVRRLVDFAAGPEIEVPDIFGTRMVRLASDHSMAGNPVRFISGEVALETDDEWRTAMSPGRRRAMTLITAPWLLRYGYLGASGSGDHANSRPR